MSENENKSGLLIFMNIISLLPLAFFLCYLVNANFSTSIQKEDISQLILNASIALTSFLIAVIGILISVYWAPNTIDKSRTALSHLIWCLIGIICTSTFASFAALSYNLYDFEFLFLWFLVSFLVALYISIVAMINVVIKLVVGV
jgi:hypothetical protein